MPDDKQESKNKSIKLKFILYKFEPHINIAIIYPTWKPTHIGHLKSSPSNPFFGLNGSKIEPYTSICVKPKQARMKNNKDINYSPKYI